ncbi:MAG: 7-carboxy-7-deazaguanine synthase QueE [Bacteroidales bacterium]|jgi:organic radical activating enzyme|nr:7-carboxy-7-deazaguanine synthase QueE [Bacteroidales bacterium]
MKIIEIFSSIQGEGCNAGKAAFFIRLAGCNNACPFCDTKESWKNTGKEMTVEEIIAIIPQKIENVVITGGEPLLHNLEDICEKLRQIGKKIWLETSGTEKLSGKFDWICLSPKKHCTPLPEIYEVSNELKIIIEDESDFHYVETEARKVASHCRLVLQPEWSRMAKITPKMMDYILQNPQWQLSLQTHKVLNVK